MLRTPSIPSQFLEQLLGRLAVHVDDRVSEVTDGLVEQVFDVQARVGDAGRNLADHVRDVGVGNRNAPGIETREP